MYYNRFRYYDPNAGSYISQDPIGLAGNNPTLYAYVSDVNYWNDVLGLTAEVYKLVATKDGYYDVYEWGNDKPVGKTYLKEGDTWKIGETTNFRTRKDGTEIQNRYTKKWQDKNNLEYKSLQHSPNKSAKTSFQKFEASRIKKFEKQFGKNLQATNVIIRIMDRVRITSDSPSFLKVGEIGKDLRVFSLVLKEKYPQIDFDFVFCFRALYTTRGIRSKVRFEKDCNYLGMDLIMSEEEFHPYKKNIAMQRRIMGKHFFPFFAENIKKYRYKLPVLKPIEKDLVEDMRLFLIENLWLPDDSGSFKLAVIENVSYDRAMALFGKPRQKKFMDTDNGKIQDILWEVDEQTQLSARYRLIDKVWTLESYNIAEG